MTFPTCAERWTETMADKIIAPKSVAPWLAIARKELGQAEIPGDASNPRILEYLSTVQLPEYIALNDEINWCSAFANWSMVQSGFKGPNSPLARQWLKWGMALSQPRLGCIAVFARGSESWQGHVGFWLAEKAGGRISLLSGNTSNKVTIDNFHADKLLGYRWPA